jgi:ribonuclease HI
MRKPRKASWRDLPPAEMAKHLLHTTTIRDGAWTLEPRLPGELRPDFVRRVLLGETPKSLADTPEAEAVKPAGLSGYYLLNTDGGNHGNPLGGAAIGALLRNAPSGCGGSDLEADRSSHPQRGAEYRALIAGLTLVRGPRIQHIRVYTDSELVVDQVKSPHICMQLIEMFMFHTRRHHPSRPLRASGRVYAVDVVLLL